MAPPPASPAALTTMRTSLRERVTSARSKVPEVISHLPVSKLMGRPSRGARVLMGARPKYLARSGRYISPPAAGRQSWLWIQRGSELRPNRGFQAAASEIRRFGKAARKISRVTPKLVDGRSFAAVVSGKMSSSSGKRSSPSGLPRARSGDRVDPDRREVLKRDEAARRPPQPPRGTQGREAASWRGTREEDEAWRQERGRNMKRRFDERGDQLQDQSEQDLRARLHREKESRIEGGTEIKIGMGEYKKGPSSTSYCYNCNQSGHYSSTCVNPPMCYNCKKTGHRSMTCPEKKGLRLCGFGIPGGAFYSIRYPTEEKQTNECLGTLAVKEGNVTVDSIEKEMLHLFRGSSSWKIKQINEKEFRLTFPNDDMRYQLSRFKSFEFLTSNATVKVSPTDISMEAVDVLEGTWVLAFGIPEAARKEETILELAFLIGDPIEVDHISLIRAGPVRLRVNCKDPKLVNGESLVFFNGDGHKISWVVETPGKDRKDKSPPKNSKFDRYNREDDEEEEEEESEPSRGSGPFAKEEKSRDNTNKGQSKSESGSSHQQHKQQEEDKPMEEEKPVEEGGLLSKEMAEMQRIDALFEERTQNMADLVNLKPPQVVDLELTMEPASPALPSASQISPREENVFSLASFKNRRPSAAIRKSIRIPDDGVPVQAKAESLKKKINDISGKPGTFAVFNSFDPLHFIRIASACKIVLGNSSVQPEQVVSVIQAKEQAQACISEARVAREEKKQADEREKRRLSSIEGSSAKEDPQDNQNKAVQGKNIEWTPPSTALPRSVITDRKAGRKRKESTQLPIIK